MVIMQTDLLAELHLPELDLKSLQNIVTKNSARLAYLIKESNECLNKSKTIPLKEGVESMVSDFTPNDCPLSIPDENIKIIKQKVNPRKSLISTGEACKNEKNTVCHQTAEKAGIEVQECNAGDNDKNKWKESQHRDDLQIVENSISVPLNKSNIPTRTESSKDVIGSNPLEEKTEVQLPLNSSCPSSSCIPFPVGSGISILKKRVNVSSENVIESTPVKEVIPHPEPTPDLNKNSEPTFCVISEVIGNATAAFCGGGEETEENPKEAQEVQLITPKKTNDITKIKGWRRKQFFVEKLTTIEFYSIGKGSLALKKKININDSIDDEINTEEPGNIENAFVCDSLDDFLDREAELKIGYEIPHLYAEFGIKLTRDEIVSKPNLSENDIKEVETRYCMPVSLPSETIDLDDIKEESIKGVKRPSKDDTKHCKMLKLAENKRHPVKLAQKSEDKSKLESEASFSESKSSSDELEKNGSNLKVLKQSEKDINNIKLVNKLIALVVYPGPSMPLHPLVQYHLDKIRSYRTKVDKNWADFAASAVLVNEKQYKRKILPAYCCAKIETNSNVNNNTNENTVQKTVDSVSVTSKGEDNLENKNEQIKIRECSVVLEKLNFMGSFMPWCMEHSRYNCSQCGLSKLKLKKLGLRKKAKKIRVRREEELMETVIVSPQASFDKKIASLLAKKVRLLKVNGDVLKSIDCLKTLTTNTVEFIKLKFVKESFLSGYLNIWYLKPEVPGVRSRAFLTFSHTPPVPNAINLKSSGFCLNNLPKVITEIVSTENTFDSNEYAILHCDGKIWEIHGSLNIAFGKCDKNVEQIFTSAELPELKSLQETAFDILHVKAVKWWVLDLTQEFQFMELKSGNVSVIATRKKFDQAIELKSFGFLPLKKNTEGRVLGAYILQRLLPFVLIGPYYLLETNDLVLKNDSSSVPFTYYGEENVTMDYPLKFFIDSVIKNIGKSEKNLEGLWLYDKMCLDNTSYLEVVTTNSNVPPPNRYSSIEIEHGYSLNSLTNSLPSGIVKSRKDGKEEFKKITVYLYFDIIELGFVEGELQFDNSVIISHPLDRRTKMKSHKIGDWFIGIIKRRIKFIPKDLAVRWFITKHKDDLRERSPFNKFFLGGAHILTRNGIFYLLEMSDSKMEELGIDRKEIVRAIAQSEVIKEVKELKSLSNLLLNDPNKSLTMYEVLTKAVREIKKLRKIHRNLKNEKAVAEKQKLKLCSCLIRRLNYCRISFHLKMKIIEKLEPLFRNEKGILNEDFAKILKTSKIGRIYLKHTKKKSGKTKTQGKNYKKGFRPEKEKINKSKSAEPQSVISPIAQEEQPPLKKSIPTILNVSRNIVNVKDSPKYSKIPLQIEKLNSVPDQFSSTRTTYPKILKNSLLKKKAEGNVETEKVKKSEPVVEKPPNNFVPKTGHFLKLASPDLPDNIKLCWKTWSVNKLEVV